MQFPYIKPVLLGCLFLSSVSMAHIKGCDLKLAPKSLDGYTLNYQVINSESGTQDVPVKGIIVSKYSKRHVIIEETGTRIDSDLSTEVLKGNFFYKEIGCNRAMETSVTTYPQNSIRTTHLIFEDKSSGTWEQSIDNGRATLSGKFSLIKTSAATLAPESLAGFHVALIIKSTQSNLPTGTYPNAGLVVQTYDTDGSVKLKGTGPGTIDSAGTFQFKRVSANTAIEQTIQTSDFFTLPYTMVYTFKTENSGTWEQNFGNGLIKFSGTFDNFPM